MNGSAVGPTTPLSELYRFSSPSLPSLLIPSLLAPKIFLLSYLDPQVTPLSHHDLHVLTPTSSTKESSALSSP